MERYRRLIRAHVYDKCWRLDITWAEVEQLLDAGDVVEDTESEGRIKRVRFLEGWARPLHIVEVVDDEQELIVYVTRSMSRTGTAGGPAFARGDADMTCVACGRGEMVEEKHPRVVERDGRVAVVRDVPVLVCDACGEIYLDTDVAKQLDVLSSAACSTALSTTLLAITSERPWPDLAPYSAPWSGRLCAESA